MPNGWTDAGARKILPRGAIFTLCGCVEVPPDPAGMVVRAGTVRPDASGYAAAADAFVRVPRWLFVRASLPLPGCQRLRERMPQRFYDCRLLASLKVTGLVPGCASQIPT